MSLRAPSRLKMTSAASSRSRADAGSPRTRCGLPYSSSRRASVWGSVSLVPGAAPPQAPAPPPRAAAAVVGSAPARAGHPPR
jgi:hypothetical protein